MLAAELTSSLQLALALGKDHFGAALEFILGGEVADSTIQTNGIVMGDVVADDPLSVL